MHTSLLKQISGTNIISQIDLAIKSIWMKHIKKDYNNQYLLKEDTLKNAIYHHLRTELTDQFLVKNSIRIFTEYHYKNGIADIAVVQIKRNSSNDYLSEQVENVLAIIEAKYKSGGSVAPFERDIIKIENYMNLGFSENTQYYLAFIHETEYAEESEESWLTPTQQKWAKGKVAELMAYYEYGKLVWKVLSHNGLNESFEVGSSTIKKELLLEAKESFNEEKYSKDIYFYYLDVVDKSTKVTEELKEAVRYLLLWKLGKISRSKTASSQAVSTKGNYEGQYFYAGTTSSNNAAIEQALHYNLLELGIQFKNDNVTYEDFRERVDSITKTSIVLPTFYIHIWKPHLYPILDVKVWRTYLWSLDKEITKNSKPYSWKHYEDYTRFFNSIVSETELDWREVDKGLWSLGDIRF
ncbi:hypothetical protein [Sutcliffiella cohnii]|uniref:hypothetical protein n=2 Tax=Sutcliffiella cohnii TaxID=33932 RepID=UPI002E20DA71|nr:hypothetical protein [Sutcliffiella cohnii]